MELTGEHVFPVARDAVYAALLDPQMLRQAIPGAHFVERDGPGAFRIGVALKLSGTLQDFSLRGELYDVDPPGGFSLVITTANAGEADGRNATAHLALAAEGDASTTLAFHLEARGDDNALQNKVERLVREFLSRVALLLDVAAPQAVVANPVSTRLRAASVTTVEPSQPTADPGADEPPRETAEPARTMGSAESVPNLVQLSDRQWSSAHTQLNEASALYEPERTHELFPPPEKPHHVRRWLTVGVGVLVILGLLVDRF